MNEIKKRKLRYLAVAVLISAVLGAGVAWAQHSVLRHRHAFDEPPAGYDYLDEYRAVRPEVQPWKPHNPLPTSLAEIGLLADAKLVVRAIPLDPPYVFLLHDSAGHYFGFCWVSDRSNGRFLLGTINSRETTAASVPDDSACGRFLRAMAGLPTKSAGRAQEPRQP